MSRTRHKSWFGVATADMFITNEHQPPGSGGCSQSQGGARTAAMAQLPHRPATEPRVWWATVRPPFLPRQKPGPQAAAPECARWEMHSRHQVVQVGPRSLLLIAKDLEPRVAHNPAALLQCSFLVLAGKTVGRPWKTASK